MDLDQGMAPGIYLGLAQQDCLANHHGQLNLLVNVELLYVKSARNVQRLAPLVQAVSLDLAVVLLPVAGQATVVDLDRSEETAVMELGLVLAVVLDLDPVLGVVLDSDLVSVEIVGLDLVSVVAVDLEVSVVFSDVFW